MNFPLSPHFVADIELWFTNRTIQDFLSSKYGPPSNVYISCPLHHSDAISFVQKSS